MRTSRRCVACAGRAGKSPHGMNIVGKGSVALCEACASRLCACAARLLPQEPKTGELLRIDESGHKYGLNHWHSAGKCGGDEGTYVTREVAACPCDRCLGDRVVATIESKKRSGSK